MFVDLMSPPNRGRAMHARLQSWVGKAGWTNDARVGNA